MSRRVLGLCARDRGHLLMYEMLNRSLFEFRDGAGSWEQLVHDAEQHGVAPLLYKHLTHIGFTLPEGWHRTLRSLHQRTRFSNQIRNKVVAAVIKLYQQETIEVLALKGIALSNFAYADPSSRPMRDIDLLVKQHDLAKAQHILLEHGYQKERNHNIPDDYYHLPPLVKTIDGLPVTIELHHTLLPLDGNHLHWPLEKSYDSTLPLTIDGINTATLGLENNLHYLYLHGLRAPLTYEPFRFVHVADIVSLVEKYYDQINWDAALTEFSLLRSILSRLHFITPWPDQILNGLALDISRVPDHPGIPYSGWPLLKLKEVTASQLPLLLRETIFPPQWWTQVYYGQTGGTGFLKVRMFEHPRAIWRWLKGVVKQRWSKTA